MTWFSRVIRFFGFGGATLTSVARFLQSHEPYLPGKSALIVNRDVLESHYETQDVDEVKKLNMSEYRKLKKQKSKGCEVLKQCLVHHNAKSRFQVFISLREWEKTDLEDHGSSSFKGIEESWPNPMGPANPNHRSRVYERYKAPMFDLPNFSYLAPPSRKQTVLSPHVLGFCYEYGFGVAAARDEAYKYYEEVSATEYSACYNLGRMLIEDGRSIEGLDYLKKAEDLLQAKVKEALQSLSNARVHKVPDLQQIEDHHPACIKTWRKSLKKVYYVMMNTYGKLGDRWNTDLYAQKHFVLPP
jgi:tetratricopeptide (TPR) repeat protein